MPPRCAVWLPCTPTTTVRAQSPPPTASCVTCPAHGTKFDLATGQPVGEWCPNMPNLPLVSCAAGRAAARPPAGVLLPDGARTRPPPGPPRALCRLALRVPLHWPLPDPALPSEQLRRSAAAMPSLHAVDPPPSNTQIGKIGNTPKPLPTFEARVSESGVIEVNA